MTDHVKKMMREAQQMAHDKQMVEDTVKSIFDIIDCIRVEHLVVLVDPHDPIPPGIIHIHVNDVVHAAFKMQLQRRGDEYHGE